VHAASAKNGVDAMTQVLCTELGQYGVRVNGIAPGPIEGTEGITRLMPPNISMEYLKTIPLRRLGTIRDIEFATLYLASPAASYVSGHIVVVDGGAWMSQNAVMLRGMEEMQKRNSKKSKL
jgi:peroxisomal 2,4-dienoyl-CoA reductase